MEAETWIGLAGMILMAIVATSITVLYDGNVRELGQSICEEEYGMDYESYIGNVLKCQETKEQYDGIQIEIS